MRHWKLACWLGILGCAGLLAARAWAQPERHTAGNQGVVFLACGTDFSAVPTNLSRALEGARLPLAVQEVYWGSSNFVTDTSAQRNYRDKGLQLARRIRAVHASSPGQKIYLVGYSEGAAVILAAAEALPPGSVERIVLITPAMSWKYDLRPALAVAREGIDCFYRIEDNFQQLVGDLLKAPDNMRNWPAGRVGFGTVIANYGDVRLYQKLRQHPWTQQMEEVVDFDGHFAYTRMRFLEHYVIPLLRQPHLPPHVPRPQGDVG
jgi:pimeloyl-ACP methyl ester carboxylesterase